MRLRFPPVLVFALFASAATWPNAMEAAAAKRIVVFRAPGFPTVDAPAIVPALLDEALAGLHPQTVADLRELEPDGNALLVLPYGSAFPLEAWSQIRHFV